MSVNHLVFGQQDPNDFPKSWLGAYSGTMYILKSNNVDTVDVKFEFLETQNQKRWTYRMTYKSPKYGDIVKDYELIKPDSLKEDTYLLDEKNGILIEEIILGNTLYSSFSVSGYRLFGVLRKEGRDLFYEIVTTKNENSLISKNKADKPEQVFEVKSYLPFTTQFVRFKKD